DILGTLGRPSFEGAFEKNRLYYISQRMIEPVAGTRTTKSRVIYILTFDGNDLLQSIDLKDERSGINIAYIDEKTPTPGDTYGLIEQMFSNIGRPQASQ
ncbi:MAG: outer membrane protein assembly factor BamE, partial [Candidatus Puniceispirillum sp.]